MSFDVLNPLMLLAMAGVALPVLVHLLSRKKFDVVQWGAMQFLELQRRTRRRIRLEELLLLAVRMGLIALLAFAFARPWGSGGFLSRFSTENRDVVFVIDGSYSMGWEGKAATPHAEAIQFGHRFLEELRSGDTVMLLDARDQVRPVIESPTHDFDRVREAFDKLPAPAGGADLAGAIAHAVQLLGRTTNLRREVIMLTDGQARGWSADDELRWTRVDDLKQQPGIEPRIWVVNVQEQGPGSRINFSVDRLKVSRELTVPGFPVRITTTVRYTGGEEPVTRRVFFEVDGQRLAEKTLQVRLMPEGEASVEFEHRFRSKGSQLVGVVLEADPLPGDNRAEAAVRVAEALPVLIVDGDPRLDATRSESFFASAALSASANETPWVQARVRSAAEFTADDMTGVEVVILANVARLTDEQAVALQSYVSGGGGLWIALGDKTDQDWWTKQLDSEGGGLLPAGIERVEQEGATNLPRVYIDGSSLELPWLTRFRPENGSELSKARFSHWWVVKPARAAPIGPEEPQSADERTSPAIVAARLNTGDPLFVVRTFGRGSVLLMTSSLDADWNTLPARPDYVPLLHEAIFYLASSRTVRNVETGEPIVLPVPPAFPANRYAFHGPGESLFDVELAGDESRPAVRLSDTRLPGVYTLKPKASGPALEGEPVVERFVVNFDRDESDLSPLADADRALLTQNERMTFASSRDELKQQMFADSSRAEFWHILLFIFLGVLVFETAMTRRLVKGGHAVDEDDQATPSS